MPVLRSLLILEGLLPGEFLFKKYMLNRLLQIDEPAVRAAL